MNKRFFNRHIIEFLVILVLGLTPLLWFHNNQVILGHDAGLPLMPVDHFHDRLYLWTDRLGFGSDQSYAVPGIFIHGLEALVSSFGFSLQREQQITFIFWFILPGLTMYFLARKLEKKFKISYFVLPVTIFYMFNHFLLQGWFIAERTKFSLYAALPLLVAFLFDWEEGNRSTFRTSLYIGITFLFLNGEGSLPLFGGTLLTLFSFSIYFFIKDFSIKRVIKLLLLIIYTGLTSLLLQAYWLISFAYYVVHFYSKDVAQAGGSGGILDWVSYISQSSSLSNILRLQGIPEWYENPLHPYAGVFLSNPFLILISFLIPICVFISLLFYKDKNIRRYILFFSFLALLSIIFVAGTHPPFGSFYILMIKFIPGFIAFRSAFYKFAMSLWFSYALLIGFSISFILSKIKDKNLLKKILLYSAICLGIILYSYPFLNGIFFDYIQGQRSMRVNVPNYIFDYANWSKSKDRIHKKTLALPSPSQNFLADAYSWGYWSLAPLTSLLTNAPIINKSTIMSKNELDLTSQLYTMMEKNEPGWENFAHLLGIKSFLLRNDFAWKLHDSPTKSPELYKNALLNSPDITLVKKFGSWEVYDFKNEDNNNVNTSSSLAYFTGNVPGINKIVNLPEFNPKIPLFITDENIVSNYNKALSLASEIYIKPDCINCTLQVLNPNLDNYKPLIIRGSRLYPFYSLINKINEKSLIGSSSEEKIHYYLYDSLTKVLAFDEAHSEEKGNQILLLTINDYNNSLIKLINSINDSISDLNSMNNLEIEINDVIDTEKSIFLNDSVKISNPLLSEDFNKSYVMIVNINNLMQKKIWETIDPVHKRFFVSVPKDDLYNIYYTSNQLGNFDKIPFSVDGSQFSLNMNNNAKNQIYLTKGTHRLEIDQPYENLYESGLSGKSTYSDKASCSFSNDISVNKNDFYRMSFEDKNVEGNRNLFVRITDSNKMVVPLDNSGWELSPTYYWEKFSFDYKAPFSKKIYLAICSYPSSDSVDDPITVDIRNVVVQKLSIPDLVLYASVPFVQNHPRIENERDEQVSYALNLTKRKKSDSVITLNESYSPDWDINTKAPHILINGYANGWIANNLNNYDNIKIWYKPQEFLRYGFYTSIISFVAILIFLIVKRKENK